MSREASRWPASTPSKPISVARAITVARASSSSAPVNTLGFSPLAGSRINAEEMERSDNATFRNEVRKLLGRACTVFSLQFVAAGAGDHRHNDDASVNPSVSRHIVKRARRRCDEDNIGSKKLFVVGHPHSQLMAEGGCPRAACMRFADRNLVRRSFDECCCEGAAHTPCADNDNLFHASPHWSKTDGL